MKGGPLARPEHRWEIKIKITVFENVMPCILVKFTDV